MAVKNNLAPTQVKPQIPKQTFTDYITQEKIKNKIMIAVVHSSKSKNNPTQ